MSEFDSVSRLEALTTSLDDFWLIFSGFMVLLMQLGFAFLEAGCVRFKNMQSIMIKVLLNTFIAIICWWACGYGIAFGQGSDFIGKANYGGSGFRFTHNISHWIYQTSVASAANSIVSGGACERMTIPGYALISILFSAFLYPLSIRWAYVGWLYQMGYHDMAGSGVIHLNGAIGALVITYMLKPRNDRYNESKAHEFEPSNTPFIALATLSLYVCWMFFNAGGTGGISDGKAYILGRTACNTLISGASGGITVMVLHYYLNKKNQKNRFSLVMLCNGNLAGLVAVTGSCDGIEMWAAFVIGIMGGITYVYAAKGFYILKIDDPVDALPIHGACGFIGAIFPGLFDIQNGAFYGNGGHQLTVQLLGIVVWIAWSGALHCFGVTVLKKFNLLNVSVEDAYKGIDFSQVGGPAYFYDMLPPQDYELNNSNNNNLENFEIIKNFANSPMKPKSILVSERKANTDHKDKDQEVEMVNNFQI